MHGAGPEGAPEQRFIWGWTYVARGSALLALPIQPPEKDDDPRSVAGPGEALREHP